MGFYFDVLDHASVGLRVAIDAEIQLFQNIVMLYIKLKGMAHAAI